MDISYLDVVTTWLEQNNDWLGVAIFLVAMVESLVAVGIVVPGVAMLFALGVIAGTGTLSIYATLVWAFSGAIVGDGLSFWIGYRYHEALRVMWPFRKYPQWLEHGESFFQKYGALSVVIGRFVGPVRPIIPVVAGMMDMRPLTFYTVNIISALGWAPVYLLPGFFTGAALSMGGQFPDQLAYVLFGIVAAAIILPGAFLWLRQRSSVVYPVIAVISLLVFIALLIFYATGQEDAANYAVYQWLSPLRQEWLIEIMNWITWLGTLPVLLSLLLATAVWSYFRGNLHDFKPLIWQIPALEASLWLLKWQVSNPRPSDVVGLDPFSFPSGHTTQAAFFLCWIAIQTSKGLTVKLRWSSMSLAFLLILLVAFSRLILNVHWIGDVTAGLMLGLFWLFVARTGKNH